MCGYLLLDFSILIFLCRNFITFFFNFFLSFHCFPCTIYNLSSSLILHAHRPKSSSPVQGTKCDVREGEDVKNLVAFVQKNLKYIDIWVFTSNSSFSSAST